MDTSRNTRLGWRETDTGADGCSERLPAEGLVEVERPFFHRDLSTDRGVTHSRKSHLRDGPIPRSWGSE